MPQGLLGRLNIRSRLFLLFLGVAMPLLLMGSYAILKEHQNLHNEAKRATTFQAAIVVRTLSHWINAQWDGLQALSLLPEISQLDADTAKVILKTSCNSRPDWRSLVLVNSQAKVIAASLPVKANSLRGEEFVEKLLKSGRPLISGFHISPVTQAPALTAGVPIVVNKQTRAALLADIEPHAVLKLFQGLGERGGSVITIVDATKKVLARTLNNDYWLGRDFSQAKTVQAAKLSYSGTLEAVGIADSIARAYAFDRCLLGNWLVVVGVPTQSIYGPAHNRLLLMVMLGLCALGISITLAYAATGHFTKPINEMVREALSIGKGDLSKRVRVRGGDELGLLARAFNQMAGNLQLNREHQMMVEKISESVRQSLDLTQILNTTVVELGQALGASRCCLALIDARSHGCLTDDQLLFNYVFHSPELGGTALQNRSVVITENSLLKTILEQGSILSLDVSSDRSLAPMFENQQPYPEDWKSIKSLLACPISTHQRPLGLILVHQCNQNRIWTDAEMELVEAVARHVALAMEQASLYAQTKSLAEQESLINQIVSAVRSSLNLDTILNTVTKELGQALKVDRCQIAQPDSEGKLLVTHEFSGQDESMIGMPVCAGKDSVQGILPSCIDPALSPVAIDDASSDERIGVLSDFVAKQSSKSIMLASLADKDKILGALIVHQLNQPRKWSQTDIRLISGIADQVAVAISHAHLFAQVRHQAITDGLTGLYNHVYLKRRLTEELKRAQRKGVPLSLLMVDLDKLKEVNDTFGHQTGDSAIRQVSRTLKSMLRSGDTAARYGGEEFAIILPDASLPTAAHIAQRLCQQVNNALVPGLGRISVSIGAASFPDQASSLQELVERADKALYEAKRCGRNQVKTWGDPDQQANAAISGRTSQVH